jgi:hypothetical protein
MCQSIPPAVSQPGFQILNRFHKALPSDRHDQINGIKIDFAFKASGQVGFRVGRRMKSVANRTAEPKVSCTGSRFKSQPVDKLVNIDFIAQSS